MIIVGFGHQKRVGKNLFAEYLKKELTRKHPKLIVQTGAFAEKVYEVCHDLYGWAGFETYQYYLRNPHKKEIKLNGIKRSPREILIKLGFGARKAVYKDTWVNYLLRNISGHISLITDVRFLNEVKLIKERGGKVYLIERPGLPTPTDVADIALSDYSDWDAVINNDGSKFQLKQKAKSLATKLLKEWEI